MSAFAGYVGFAGPAPCGTAARFANSLDGAGLRRARTLEDGSTVFVVRQRILSPEDRFERQPVAGDGLVSLFDGRLDNRGELLDLLGLTSPADDPLPDGELVRRAYLCWREAAPARLLGDFAWALWDAAGRRLMLARDHSLQRSLYFCRVDGGVAFATGYRPLLALPGVSAELDETAVADLLLIAPDESGRSLYKQISWVGAAVRVLITPDGVWEDRLWEPTAQPVLRLKDDRDYAEAARAVFNQAVACRRRVAGPVVAAVSGGLDSSAVTATAAMQAAPDLVQAICLVPSGEGPADIRNDRSYGDERPYVEALARLHPNLRVHYVTPTAPETLEINPTGFFVQFGAPTWSPNNGSWFLSTYRKAAELGATSMLLGTMGNLTFSAEGDGLLAGLLRQRAWGSLVREAWHMARSPDPSGEHPLRHELLTLLPRAMVPPLRRLKGLDKARWQSLPLNPDFVRDANLAERLARYGVGVDRWMPDRLLQDMRFMVLRSRMAMEARAATRILSGVTGSDPFSDRRIIEFCLSLPADQFRRASTRRRFPRIAFADRLPPEITGNFRRGAQNVEWFRRLIPHRESYAADLERLERSPLASRLLDLAHLRQALAELPAGEEEAYRSNWLRRYNFLRGIHVARYLAWIDRGNGQGAVNGSPDGP